MDEHKLALWAKFINHQYAAWAYCIWFARLRTEEDKMGKLSRPQRLKEFIGSTAWRVFLWSIDKNEDEYWEEIARGEVAMKPDYWRKYINNIEQSRIDDEKMRAEFRAGRG